MKQKNVISAKYVNREANKNLKWRKSSIYS